MDRRKFLKGMGAAVAVPLLMKGGLYAQNKRPSNTLNIGVIGLGYMCNRHVGTLMVNPRCRIVALCDIDDTRLNFQKARVESHYKKENISSDIKLYKDFRDVLANKDVDAVFIVTPDHWHAINCILAAKAGKHIFCEKPLTFSIEEGRKVEEAVKKAGIIFQLGSFQRSEEAFRKAAFIAKNGYIGEIKEFYGELNYKMPCIRNWAEEPIPPNMDWDMWCGPAPYNPYSNYMCPNIDPNAESPYDIYGGFPDWRSHRDYSNANQTDWGAHHYDIALWALGLDGKGIKRAVVSDRKDINGFSNWRQFYLETETGIKIYKGRLPEVGLADGAIFVGTEGIVSANRGDKFYCSKPYLFDIKYDEEDVTYMRNTGHIENFLDGCFYGTKTIADVSAGRSSCEACLVGMISSQLGKTLEWDYVSGRFTNCEEANKFLGRKARGQWANI